MNFDILAERRFSCRKFADKEVEPELIDKIIEIAMLAPTAVNKQPYKIFRMKSQEAKKSIEQVTRFSFGAKEFLAVGYKEADAWTRKYDDKNFAVVDASIVATHIMMAITDLGLASTWVGHFDAPALKAMYPQMNGYEMIAIFPIGYAAEEPCERHFERKTKDAVVQLL